MKKIITMVLGLLLLLALFTGCRQSDRVSYNLSLQADNFNVVRQLTVINSMTGDVLFQMTGKMSIETDSVDEQLEIVVERENGTYHKHFVYLGTMALYVVEDLGETEADRYKYTLNFNPKMWIPVNIETVD